ncbi:hypothetical protein A3G63_00890 [Candidatus Kaiserbacteria bacterium RIFCSPLOWO2_12_FULL_52_8]|uniref:Hydrolase TatD n=1 Tax=Candidatus Kaiserbacteria bacterium RIFCSPHIGHO2_01_FULL_53_31 TaxID=1798481 RepID=A0A1F6CJH3_9BACT|nr:MAG: hypothetical protein A2678_00880 [Candidatus Kaiserbacteria bacterium RIFCSPHIGHO2_01_FULL_53_31]OGG94454.1 MAG: hypothetical protein A3G63_00890 [Candidatus Kaiserbacteria bacterium RIFCSPLOWO2_12_FULL_52_8]
MQIKYVDTHCHLQFPEYDADREEIIEKMSEKGIVGIVVGCDYESSRKAVLLAEKYDHLFASIGHMPQLIGDFDAHGMRALIGHPKVVAVGECGLDYYRVTNLSADGKNRQKVLFKKQIDLAVEYDKPLIVHTRPSQGTMDAYRDLIAILKVTKFLHPDYHGNIHFFVGGKAEVEALVALNFTVSFTAVITFARDYDAVIKAAPFDRILSETDSPYVAPVTRRGERNDPLAVIDVVNQIALIRGVGTEIVRQKLLANTLQLFDLPGRETV